MLLGIAMAMMTLPCSTYACDCEPSRNPIVAKDAAAAVFAGRVEAIEPIKSRLRIDGRFPFVHTEREIFWPRRVTFAVAEVWKGRVGRTVVVATGGQCGTYPFVRDGAYLVYAHADGTSLSATMCSRVKAFNSVEDRDALGVGTKIEGFQLNPVVNQSATGFVFAGGATVVVLLGIGLGVWRRRSG